MDASRKSNQVEKWLPAIVCAMASFFYIYEFIVRVIPSAIAGSLMQAFHLHAGGLGILASSFFWAYTPMQIPAGLLYDRYGPRRLLTISILLCAGATILFATTDNIYLAATARFMMGLTGAFAFIGPLLIGSRWLKSKHFSLFTGIVQLMGCIGAIAGLAPIAALSTHFGWRETNLSIAVLGFIFAIAMWITIRDHPEGHPVSIQQEWESETSRLKQVCHRSQTWWVGVYGLTTWAPITVLATLWGTPFLSSVYHIDATHAGGLISMIWVGIAVGSPLIGWWSNFIHSRRIPMWICSSLAILSSLGVIYSGAVPRWEMSCLLFALGVSAGGQVVSFGTVLDNNSDKVMGTAVGFNNMAVIAGAIVLQPLVGFLLSFFWNHDMQGGIPVYSSHEFHIALAIVPIVSLAGLFLGLFAVRETHCVRKFPTEGKS
ncbi:MAG TPA: MFS transporter [Coxiellaceae bacterium]|nr:MFS transporter [Coxiellaceae bacterium]